MLEKVGRDLVDEARKNRLPAVLRRDELIKRALQFLGEGRSLVLTGEDGCGKTALVHGIAHAMVGRERGKLYQMSAQDLLAGTQGLIGQWQTRTKELLDSAQRLGAVIYVGDGPNLVSVGKTIDDASSVWDMIKPRIEAKQVRLVIEAGPERMRALRRIPDFLAHFVEVQVPALAPELADELLDAAANAAGTALAPDTRTRMNELAARFMPAQPLPGPVLRLLEQMRHYAIEKARRQESEPLTPAFVDKVFSIYSGLPRFVISHHEQKPVTEIRAALREQLVGQSAAIEAVVETIALFKAGLNDPRRPIGTLLFVGPTGVGKTELAKALARFLFGSIDRLLRIDMSELKDYQAFQQLLGKPSDPDQPARLIDPVRVQPFQVILLDEIEKAHDNVWDLLLQLLDEGRLTSARGETVSFCNTIVICTSNVGAGESAKSLGFGGNDGEAAREQRIRAALAVHFRPELLNRFQHVVVFHALSREQLRRIARQVVARFLRREGLVGRNLVLDVDDAALDHVIDRGYDVRYGARALERELQRQLLVPVAAVLMERSVNPGSILRVTHKSSRIVVRVVDTDASAMPDASSAGTPADLAPDPPHATLPAWFTALAARLTALSASVDEARLTERTHELDVQRGDPDLWRDSDAGAALLRELDRARRTLDRLERMRGRIDDIQAALADPDRRSQRIARDKLQGLEQRLSRAELELTCMGEHGELDALVEIRPVGAEGRPMRDLLSRVYREWAEARRFAVDVLFEPLADDQRVLFALCGSFAAGYLALECGLHRLRGARGASTAEVLVRPWLEGRAPADFGEHRALKLDGQLGGRVRSYLECPPRLALQNARTLAENRELAVRLARSFAGDLSHEGIVRRYDEEPFLIRDSLIEPPGRKPEALEPEAFGQLLIARRLAQPAR